MVFTLNKDSREVLEYQLIVELSKGDEVKVTDKDMTSWYPSGESDSNYTVTADGTYEIYFRPNYDGNADWFNGVLYLRNVMPLTVTFNTDGGNTIENELVYYNLIVSEPETPTKKGYTFLGWYNGDTAYDFNTPVTENLTLTAKWQENTINIIYIDINSIKTTICTAPVVTFDESTLTLPSAPYLDGYNFIGWNVDGTNYTSTEEVKTAVQSLVNADRTKNIEIKEVYEKKTDTFSVTVTNGTLQDGTKSGTYQVSTIIKVTRLIQLLPERNSLIGSETVYRFHQMNRIRSICHRQQ